VLIDDDLSEVAPPSDNLSGLSWKLNRLLAVEGAGLSMAGDMFLKKSR